MLPIFRCTLSIGWNLEGTTLEITYASLYQLVRILFQSATSVILCHRVFLPFLSQYTLNCKTADDVLSESGSVRELSGLTFNVVSFRENCNLE